MIPGSLRKALRHETRWSRTYEVDKGYYAYESKFEADGLSIEASELSSIWDSWSESEKLDFAKAFDLKVPITPADEKVVEFLMLHGDEPVLSSITTCITQHSNRDTVVSFLVDLLSSGVPKANFLQALGKLGDQRAIDPIKKLHDRLAEDMRPGTNPDRRALLDFFVSCLVLNKLQATSSYRRDIEPFLSDPDEKIRNLAKLWIDGGP